MTHYDIAIVGSGSGNTILDDRYADKKVALLDEGTFGGTCLNVGCIPTKMFVYAADVARAVEHASRYGVDASITGVRWPDIVDRVFGRIDPIADGGRRYRMHDCPNVTVYTGRARFTGPRTLDTGTGETITADQIVVAAGSRPMIPEEVTASGVRYYTNEDVMRLPELPRRLIVLGSGFIAAEFAHVFSAAGSEVSVIARSGALLRHLDTEISAHFTELARAKWDVHLANPVRAVRPGASGAQVEVELADGTVVAGDALLVAVGRRPNGDLMAPQTAGIALHPDGRVVVDEFQRSTAEGVFALGDVSSEHQLKHVANHEARVVAHNLLAAADDAALRSSDHRFVPSAVFTDPQIATVGLTEEQARARGIDVAVKVQSYADVAYGWAMEDHEGLCKLIADRDTGRLVGAHLIGAQASTLIQPLIQAMSFDLGVADMARGQYWIHPALPEVVENALLGLDL
ncbi:mycothione reductase [Speluncibacter jeojiensis]|uniref:Mycothione reductase n=1 Tax=Speluncibacter jeojiensis TaxID=2710754 RepID=A0A9X4RGE8_9ACTN|nr:mycothione reductase [Corynebacteriales bacterium D3-21]